MKLNSEDGEPLENIQQFQRLVGKLIYLTVTRPDISFAVSQISQFMHSPRTTHLDAINRILRYLKGTPGKGIWMKRNNTHDICGYSDADWAGAFDRKSTTGFCVFVGGNLVTWKSKKQNVVARSSAEAEYRAMASTTSEMICISHDISQVPAFGTFFISRTLPALQTLASFSPRAVSVNVSSFSLRTDTKGNSP